MTFQFVSGQVRSIPIISHYWIYPFVPWSQFGLYTYISGIVISQLLGTFRFLCKVSTATRLSSEHIISGSQVGLDGHPQMPVHSCCWFVYVILSYTVMILGMFNHDTHFTSSSKNPCLLWRRNPSRKNPSGVFFRSKSLNRCVKIANGRANGHQSHVMGLPQTMFFFFATAKGQSCHDHMIMSHDVKHGSMLFLCRVHIHIDT